MKQYHTTRSFSSAKLAEDLAKELRAKGFGASVFPWPVKGYWYYRVDAYVRDNTDLLAVAALKAALPPKKITPRGPDKFPRGPRSKK